MSTPPCFIKDMYGRKLEVLVHNEHVEYQLIRVNELKAFLGDFPDIDLCEFSFSPQYAELRNRLLELMGHFHGALSIRPFTFTSRQLLVMASIALRPSLTATIYGEIVDELRKRFSEREYGWICNHNYSIFFRIFPIDTLSKDELHDISYSLTPFILNSQNFHAALGCPSRTLDLLNLHVLLEFAEQGLDERIREEVIKCIQRKVITSRETYAVTPYNIHYFINIPFTPEMYPKIQTSCFFIEHCRAVLKFLKDPRIIHAMLLEAFKMRHVESFRYLKDRRSINLLALYTYQHKDLNKYIETRVGNLMYRRQIEDLIAADELVNIFEKLAVESPTNELDACYLEVFNYRVAVNHCEAGRVCLGLQLKDEKSRLLLARTVVENNIEYLICERKLQDNVHFFRCIQFLIKLIEKETDLVIVKIRNHLQLYYKTYPEKCLHDPLLNADLHNPEKIAPYLAIMKNHQAHLFLLTEIFQINFEKLIKSMKH